MQYADNRMSSLGDRNKIRTAIVLLVLAVPGWFKKWIHLGDPVIIPEMSCQCPKGQVYQEIYRMKRWETGCAPVSSKVEKVFKARCK